MSVVDGIAYSAIAPEGHTPSFGRPFDATALIACICIFVPLAFITSMVRIYTRSRIVSAVAIDDYCMLMALACSIALTGFILNLLNYGLGKHLYDVPINKLYPKFLFHNVMAAIFFCAATGFAKTSILLFYGRIFPSRNFQIVIWGLVVFVLSYSAASVFVNIFSCKPVSGSWELVYAATAVCINRPVFYFAQAGLGIFTDFATLITPLSSMRRLQMPVRQKIGVALVLMMGGFVCIVSIIRLQSLNLLLKSSDLTIATTPALMWCVIELNISIIGGNAPTLRPFLRKHFPRLLGSSLSPSDAYGYHSRSGTHQNKSGSHKLQSFDPNPRQTDKLGVSKTTVTSVHPKSGFGDNESEEYIIQNSREDSEGSLEPKQKGVGPLSHSGGNEGFGNITRTVEFSFTKSAT